MRRTGAALGGPRRLRMTVKHWDLLHELLEQDEEMGLSPERKLKAPWPALPPMDISTMELEWRRFRNVANLVSSGAILPPRWYRMARLAPPTSGPFWGDPPVHSVDHQYPLRRHFWTTNLKPPTELMKAFLMRKEDRVMEQNYKRVIGFTPREMVRKQLKEDVAEAARAGRSTFSFFWQRKPLERMETRFHQLRDEGHEEAAARRIVSEEFYTTLAELEYVQMQAAEMGRRRGHSISAAQATWVTGVFRTLQTEGITRDREVAEKWAEDYDVAARNHSPAVEVGREAHPDEEPPPEESDEAAIRREAQSYMRYTGLEPSMDGIFDGQDVGEGHVPSATFEPRHAKAFEEQGAGGKAGIEERLSALSKQGPGRQL
eukprot:TRINITY_DN69956_c0_g1_i1.p1 TRINITY_DN69956_c0_g1~~TRINITY_DN69956_c0_g1_i1.p1  ORF type:complete len:374 (+),score=120.35 TRINITY_DN69956_c0_g1_i1:105-1226(+)